MLDLASLCENTNPEHAEITKLIRPYKWLWVLVRRYHPRKVELGVHVFFEI